MKVAGEFVFEAPIEEVWKALLDPVVLAAVMPGCEKLDLVDGHYQGDLNVKVGPVQGRFGGKVDLRDLDEPNGYTLLIDGRGAPGFVKATAAVKLARDGASTRMHYDADAQVGGKIASVGQRLLEASARAISKQSLEGLNENIKLRAAASPSAPTPSAPAPASTAAAPVTLKTIDQRALAASVAKEVTRSLLPRPELVALLLVLVCLVLLAFLR